ATQRMAAAGSFLSTPGSFASNPARSGANRSNTPALARLARALFAPTVFSSAADAPITARRRSPVTCNRLATGLSDTRPYPTRLFKATLQKVCGDRVGAREP